MSRTALRRAPSRGLFAQPTVVVPATGVVLGGVLGGLAYSRPVWAAGAMVVAVCAAAFVFSRLLGTRLGLVVLLIVTCLIDRHTFSLGRLSIRPEQVSALIALGVLVAVRLREGSGLTLRPNLAEMALLAWFLLGFMSSVLMAPSRSQSLKILALLIISSLALFLPRQFFQNRLEQDRSEQDRSEGVDEAVRWLLLAFAAEGAYALVVYFLRLWGPIVSLSVNPASGHLNAYGTLWEPNVLGAVCGAGAIAWIYVGTRFFKRAWIGIALCLSGSVVSFARAAWLATALVLVLSLVLPLRRRIDLRSLVVGVVVTLIVGGGVLGADRLGNYNLGSSRLIGGLANNVDLLGRLYQFGTVFSDFKGSPPLILLGGGPDSFGERHTTAGQPQHVANLELAIFNDTGLLGVGAFGVFAVAIALAAWRKRIDPTVRGLGAMSVVLAITNVATETLELMITWLLLGLLLAAVQAAGSVSSPATAHTVRDTGL
jgi:hypothetical protein